MIAWLAKPLPLAPAPSRLPHERGSGQERYDVAHACGHMTKYRAAQIELSQLRRLEIASVAEATTLLLLLGLAVPLKHLGGWSMGVHVAGPVHGLAFLAY